MKIGLIDVDSHNFPNLALMKISAYYKSNGDVVEWHNGFEYYDIIYMSKVFTTEYTPNVFEPVNADMIIKGGTGYNLHNILPNEIEHIYPDYSLYPKHTKNTAYGFLTRGCPRACKFCIVAEKEGKKSVKVADLKEFWDGQKIIKLLDPNLLACKEHKELLQQLIDCGCYIDFTQGLDSRLITEENARLLARVKTKMVHFAMDDMTQIDQVVKGLKIYSKAVGGVNYRKARVYLLTNFNTTHEEDMYRVRLVQSLGYWPYIMIFNKSTAPQITRHLQRWSNNPIIYNADPVFENYDHRKG